MNDTQPTTQSVAGVPGLQLPAGTDDNGNPYWFIDGRKVFWAEMQQYIWQMQKQQPVATATGSGPEGMGQMIMPNVESQLMAPTTPEVPPQLENRMETAGERGVERKAENAGERVQTRQQSATAPVATKTATTAATPKPPSLIGDSPSLTQVDTSNPASIVSYVEAHQKDSPDNSSRFLSELLGKIVKVFSLEH